MSTNSPDGPRMSDHRAAQIREALMAETRDETGRDSAATAPFRNRRTLSVVGVTAASVVVVGGTAAAWVSVSRPDDAYSVYCSASVTTDPDIWKQHGATTATNADTGVRAPLDAIDACAAMWRTGTMTGDRAPTEQAGPATVPDLTACVVDAQLVVYPGPAAVCAELKVPAAAK